MTKIRKVVTYSFVDLTEYNDPDNIIVITDWEKDDGWVLVSNVGNSTSLQRTITYEPGPIV